MDAAQSIFRAHQPLDAVYFPETSVIAMLSRLNDGEVLQVGVVGKDGMAGIALLPGVNMMPCDAIVQIAGTALRMGVDALKHTARQPGLHEVFARYAYLLFAQGVQSAACNAFHSAEQRCARWLLMIHDLVDGDEFPVTQNVLATMVGVRRPTVTMMARALQRAQVIDYRHGHMKIRHRRRLEACSCECYRMMREEQHRLLGY
jgi:CRP-like cAMP-binding protein